MSPTARLDTAGSLTTLTTSLLMTLHRTISVETVSGSLIWLSSWILTIYLAPKFQGDNFYKNKAIVEEIKKISSRRGCAVSQVALAWVAAQGMIAIPGTTKAKRLEDNWASRDIELTDEEEQEMRKIIDSAKPHGNRYSEAHQAMVGH